MLTVWNARSIGRLEEPKIIIHAGIQRNPYHRKATTMHHSGTHNIYKKRDMERVIGMRTAIANSYEYDKEEVHARTEINIFIARKDQDAYEQAVDDLYNKFAI